MKKLTVNSTKPWCILDSHMVPDHFEKCIEDPIDVITADTGGLHDTRSLILFISLSIRTNTEPMGHVGAHQRKIHVVDIRNIRVHGVVVGYCLDVGEQLLEMRNVGREILKHLLHLHGLILGLGKH